MVFFPPVRFLFQTVRISNFNQEIQNPKIMSALFWKNNPRYDICLVLTFTYHAFIANSSSPYIYSSPLIFENFPTSTFILDPTFIQDLRVVAYNLVCKSWRGGGFIILPCSSTHFIQIYSTFYIHQQTCTFWQCIHIC